MTEELTPTWEDVAHRYGRKIYNFAYRLTGDPEDSRPHFRQTRQLFERLKALSVPGVSLKHLSMGMSDSYCVAIEEGATMIRLGTVVFGRRGGG